MNKEGPRRGPSGGLGGSGVTGAVVRTATTAVVVGTVVRTATVAGVVRAIVAAATTAVVAGTVVGTALGGQLIRRRRGGLLGAERANRAAATVVIINRVRMSGLLEKVGGQGWKARSPRGTCDLSHTSCQSGPASDRERKSMSLWDIFPNCRNRQK